MVENHSLVRELPEFKEAIHELKIHNAHFARLFEQYHKVDKEIHRIESGVENTSDEYLEGLKRERLRDKDEMFIMLQEYHQTPEAS